MLIFIFFFLLLIIFIFIFFLLEKRMFSNLINNKYIEKNNRYIYCEFSIYRLILIVIDKNVLEVSYDSL